MADWEPMLVGEEKRSNRGEGHSKLAVVRSIAVADIQAVVEVDSIPVAAGVGNSLVVAAIDPVDSDRKPDPLQAAAAEQ